MAYGGMGLMGGNAIQGDTSRIDRLIQQKKDFARNTGLFAGFDPEPPPGMMLNPEYERWKAMYDMYPTNLRGGMGQDMTNDMNRWSRMQMGPAPQQWLYDPNWEADEAGKKPPPPPPPPPPPGGGIDRPAKFAPPPGGYTNWRPPVAPPNVGGGGSGEVPPLFLPPPGQRDDLFHKAPNPAIAQVAQALLGRR